MIYTAVCILAAIGGLVVVVMAWLLLIIITETISDSIGHWTWGLSRTVADEVVDRIQEMERRKQEQIRGSQK